MAARKPYLKTSDVNVKLKEKLEAIRDVVVSDEDLREQRVSFAFGNAMGIDDITKESVRTTSDKMRITG